MAYCNKKDLDNCSESKPYFCTHNDMCYGPLQYCDKYEDKIQDCLPKENTLKWCQENLDNVSALPNAQCSWACRTMFNDTQLFSISPDSTHDVISGNSSQPSWMLPVLIAFVILFALSIALNVGQCLLWKKKKKKRKKAKKDYQKLSKEEGDLLKPKHPEATSDPPCDRMAERQLSQDSQLFEVLSLRDDGTQAVYLPGSYPHSSTDSGHDSPTFGGPGENNGIPTSSDPRSGTPTSSDPRSGTTTSSDPRSGTPTSSDSGNGTPTSPDPRSGTTTSSDPRSGTPTSSDPRSGTPTSSDSGNGTPTSSDPTNGTHTFPSPTNGTHISTDSGNGYNTSSDPGNGIHTLPDHGNRTHTSPGPRNVYHISSDPGNGTRSQQQQQNRGQSSSAREVGTLPSSQGSMPNQFSPGDSGSRSEMCTSSTPYNMDGLH